MNTKNEKHLKKLAKRLKREYYRSVRRGIFKAGNTGEYSRSVRCGVSEAGNADYDIPGNNTLFLPIDDLENFGGGN